MAHRLEIHHIDVGQGDSTLILVRDEANNAIKKSALIDGGLLNQASTVHAYLTGQGVTSLDILVASHFDKDHFYGLRGLLAKTGTTVYDSVNIYDRGEEGRVNQFGAVDGRENDFQLYVNAAGCGDPANRNASKPKASRTRHTAWLKHSAKDTPGWGTNTWKGEDYLVNTALFNLGDNEPKMTCIAANHFVSTSNTTSSFIFGGLGIDDNASSLGFVIQFGAFRYYTAGDLEIPQEEHVANRLNPRDGDHVCAFKLSHHGAATSTSKTFFEKLRPRAGFISCGDGNSYGHAKPSVLALLEAATSTVQNYYLTSCGSADSRPHLPGANGTDQTNPGTRSRVAGSTNQPGHIVLSVSSAQAAAHQFSVRYWDWDLNNGTGGNVTINHTC